MRRVGLIPSQKDADEGLCGPDRCYHRADAQDVHDAFEVIRQYVQRHLGADPFERPHLEVGCPHPRLDGPEGMLDGFAARAHLVRLLVEAALHGFENMFVFPPRDAALLARGAAILDRAAPTRSGP